MQHDTVVLSTGKTTPQENQPSKQFEDYSLQRDFSHLYIETAAFDYELTQVICRRFSKATVVKISNYKEIFNRPRQDWSAQKQSMKLILAVKPDGFLYAGSHAAQNFGYEHFYYNSLVLNCLYDCEYCYLQGMYPSANIVIFVNESDFFAHTQDTLKIKSPLYLCISYDTDLLALEGIVPLASRWIEFAKRSPGLVIELRTKSANYRVLESVSPAENVILAWTLSPQEIIDKHEAKTPSLQARLKAAAKAQADGWKVRLCFDPILHVHHWQELYGELISQTFGSISAQKLASVSVGSFRMNQDHFRQAKKVRSDSKLYYGDFYKESGLQQYQPHVARELEQYVSSLVAQHLDLSKIEGYSLSDGSKPLSL